MADTTTRFGAEASNLADQAAEVTKSVGNTISDAATTLRDKTQDVGRAAKEKMDESRISTANALRSVASGLHDNAGKLPNVPDLAHSAAARFDEAAGYLESRDMDQLMSDVGHVVKRNPIPSLVIAALAGFFIGRALSNNR